MQPRAPGADDYLTRNLAEISRFIEENTQLEAVRGRDYDGLEAMLRDLARAKSWEWKGAERTLSERCHGMKCWAAVTRRKRSSMRFIAASDADLAPLLHEELQAAMDAYRRLEGRPGASISSIS